MITKDQVMPLMLQACPTFGPRWEEHLEEYGDDLLYVAAGWFARHLLELHMAGQIKSFPAVALAIEQLHVSGDDYVRELATIGFLEAIQNVWSHSVDPELFAQHLHPVSAKWWQSFNDFWAGKIRFVGDPLTAD